MSQQMRAFQSSFVAALLGAPVERPPWSRQAGFAVYANTVLRAAIDALAANVPTVHALLGDDVFDSVAGAFVREHPPSDGSLARYGAGLPEFLAVHRPLAELDYLRGVAALDLAWIASHLAADAPVLGRTDVFALTAEQLLHGRLVPHPATRWLDFAMPAFTIWRRHREHGPTGDPLPWRAEVALLARPRGRVEWRALDPGEAEFLAASARGVSCDEALECAVAGGAGFDLALALPRLIEAGAFTRIDGNPA